MFVLNQITDRVSLLEPKHGPDLIDIAASVDKPFCNRSPCGKCRHALESGPCEDPAVDVQEYSAPVLPSVAHCSHSDRQLVTIPGEKQPAVWIKSSVLRPVLRALPAPSPFFQIGVNGRDDLRAGKEKRPLCAVDGRIGAHHRFFAYEPVFGQVVAYQEPCDFQGLGRRRQEYEQQGRVPFSALAVLPYHRHSTLDVLVG